MLFRLAVITLLSLTTTNAFFFGGGGGGCGCQPQPACAPPPPPSPCSGGNIVQGYVGAPQPQGYAAPPPPPQYPQAGGYAPQGGYQGQPMSSFPSYQPPPQPVAPAPAPAPAPVEVPVESAPVQAGGTYQEAPAQAAPAQVEPAQAETQPAYQGEQEVVASLAREEPNYQNTGTNVIEAAQHASELGSQAAAAAAKVAEVIEEDDEPIKKKDEGKTAHHKTAKTPVAATVAPAPASEASGASGASTEFPVGEEIVADTNEKEVDISELHLTDDPLCNSDDLRKVVIDNIDDQLNSSKRMIQLAAEAQFGGRFDVICANGDFSYVTNTELYCQETKGDISCYTYRQL